MVWLKTNKHHWVSGRRSISISKLDWGLWDISYFDGHKSKTLDYNISSETKAIKIANEFMRKHR